MLALFNNLNRELVRGISRVSLILLIFSQFWVVLSIICWGISVGVLATILGSSIFAGVLIGIFIAFFFLIFDSYTQTSIHLTNMKTGPDKLKLSGLRLFFALLMIFICLLFTQPIFMLYVNYYDKISTNIVAGDFDREHLQASRNIAKVRELKTDLSDIYRLINQSGTESLINISNSEEFNDISFASVAQRKALIIGNNEYIHAGPLLGAVTDAVRMSDALKKLGFDVLLVTNGTRENIEYNFRQYLNNLQPGDVSFFFYSGHGFQNKGNNYIVPIDFSSDMDDRMMSLVSITRITEAISRRKILASIIAIDACRKELSAVDSQGLAPIQAGDNTYIALAAAPGKLSFEKEILIKKRKTGKREGIFTTALLKHINEPIDIDRIFREANVDVGKEVKILTGNPSDQEIWVSHNLKGEFILAKNDMTKHETKNLAVENSCSAYAGNNSNISSGLYYTCLKAKALELSDDIKLKNEETKQILSGKLLKTDGEAKIIKDKLTLYKVTWKNPIKPLVITAILFLILSGGFFLRLIMHIPMMTYSANIYEDSYERLKKHVLELISVAKRLPYRPSDEYLERIFNQYFVSRDVKPTVKDTNTDALLDYLSHKS